MLSECPFYAVQRKERKFPYVKRSKSKICNCIDTIRYDTIQNVQYTVDITTRSKNLKQPKNLSIKNI